MYFVIAAIWLVCFWEKAVTYLPFEDTTLAVLTQMPEFVIILGVLWMQGSQNAKRRNFRGIGYGLDFLLVGFLLWLALSTILANNAAGPFLNLDSFVALLNIKALIRFLAIFYLVARVDWTAEKYRKVRNAFLIVVALQAFIGVLQLVIGRPALEFFSPRTLVDVFGANRDAFVDRERDEVEIFGTFRNTISYAYLMMVGAIVVLVSKFRIGLLDHRVIAGLLLPFVFLSGSRAVFLLAAMIYLSYFVKFEIGRLSKSTIYSLALLSIVLVTSIYFYLLSLELSYKPGSFGFVFTPGYIEAAMNGRLGVMVLVLPKLMSSPQFLFGFGADKALIVDYTIQTANIANYALIVTLDKTLEDVYWVAMLLYFGLIGTAIFVLFFIKIYGRISIIAKQDAGWISEAAEIARLLLLLSIPLNFVNQAFEVQIFSLALWSMSAIAISGWRGRASDLKRRQLAERRSSLRVEVPGLHARDGA